MVISVTNVNLDVLARLIEQRTKSRGLVKSRAEGLSVLQGSNGIAATQPRENFVSEWVDYFDFVVISVSHQDHIFFWYKVDAERVLEFGLSGYAVFVSIRMKVLRVRVAPHKDTRRRECLHIDGPD